MTLSALQILVLQKLNDATGIYYPATASALNEAQRRFVLLTLCLETSATFNLTGGRLSYRVLTQLSDFMLPRRILNSNGQQLRPATIAELQALDAHWQNTPGVPTRYVLRGLDWLAIYPQPAATDTLTVYYANAPAMMMNPTDTPAIRASSQYALVNWAAWALRQPEGAQELAKFTGYRTEFMREASDVRALVKERNKDSDYERMAFELTRTKR